MDKLSSGIIIHILKFHALELYIKDENYISDKFKISDRKFKISELFGYFKSDKCKKNTKLYDYLVFDNIKDDSNKGSIFISINSKYPEIIGCISPEYGMEYEYWYCMKHLYNYMTDISSLKWMYLLYSPIIYTMKRKLNPSNITRLKIISYNGDIYFNDYPKLKYIYINCLDKYVNLIGFKNWKGILLTDTPNKIYIT